MQHNALSVHLVLLVCSLVFAALATAAVPSPPRFQWFPAAFLFFILAAFFL
jgi:hypothetical protein